MSRASPSESNPGPRFALEAGTRTLYHVIPGRLPDLQDFFFLGLGGLVDLLHVAVGQLLDLVVGSLVFVFRDLLVLQKLLHGFVAVAADVSDRDAMVLSRGVQALDHLLAALLRERGNGQADDFAIVGGIEPEVRHADGLLDGPDLGDIPRRNGNQARLGYVEIGDLIARHERAAGVHADMVQNSERSAPRTDGGHLVLQIAKRLLHAALDVRFYFFYGLESSDACCMWFSFHGSNCQP